MLPFFKNKREILGYKPKKAKSEEVKMGWVILIPIVLIILYFAWEAFLHFIN
jgi:hypothetical protein